MEVGETEFLDKSGFIKDRTNSQLSFQREAELQHGRVAMLSIVILQILDKVDKTTLAINQVSSLPLSSQFGLLFMFGSCCQDCKFENDDFTVKKSRATPMICHQKQQEEKNNNGSIEV